jgi:hypothetical protein
VEGRREYGNLKKPKRFAPNPPPTFRKVRNRRSKRGKLGIKQKTRLISANLAGKWKTENGDVNAKEKVI